MEDSPVHRHPLSHPRPGAGLTSQSRITVHLFHPVATAGIGLPAITAFRPSPSHILLTGLQPPAPLFQFALQWNLSTMQI